VFYRHEGEPDHPELLHEPQYLPVCRPAAGGFPDGDIIRRPGEPGLRRYHRAGDEQKAEKGESVTHVVSLRLVMMMAGPAYQ
jgi:hypothetical protein